MFGVSVLETDGETLYDAYTNEMDMIGTCRILDVAPLGPLFAFDMFKVSMHGLDDDSSISDVITFGFTFVKGASYYIDPPLSFDSMSRFVTHYNGISTEYNNDMSVFEYSLVSLYFPMITSPTPTT